MNSPVLLLRVVQHQRFSCEYSVAELCRRVVYTGHLGTHAVSMPHIVLALCLLLALYTEVRGAV